MGSNFPVQNSGSGTNANAEATTSPTRSENSTHDNEQIIPVQPHQPTILQDLLHFTSEAIKAEETRGELIFCEVNEKYIKFLEEEMVNFPVDVAELLQEAISLLSDEERINSVPAVGSIPVDMRAAFSDLLENVDTLSGAVGFFKMGGFAMFPVCYGCKNEIIRTLTSTFLGQICHYNPLCQSKFLEYGLLNILLYLAGTEKGYALSKTLLAISFSIRGYDPACIEFVAQGGCAVLVKVMNEPERSIRNKAFFLTTVLCHNYPQSRAKFIETNLIESIARNMKRKMYDKTQIHLSILQSLVKESDPRLFKQMRDPRLRLKSTIEAILKLPELQTELFAKERDWCLQILKVYSKEMRVQEDGPDR